MSVAALDERPSLPSGLAFGLRVAEELSWGRDGGIPFEAVASYCDRAGIDSRGLWWLWDRLRGAMGAARDRRES